MGLSGYMGIVIAVLLVAALGLGKLLLTAHEEIGAFEIAQEANKRELQKATEKVAEIKALRAQDQVNILSLADDARKLMAERDAIALRMDKWRSTLDARTLAKPEVTRRAARRSLRVAQCALWRDTGGVGDCPK